jgi:hypothetical protein
VATRVNNDSTREPKWLSEFWLADGGCSACFDPQAMWAMGTHGMRNGTGMQKTHSMRMKRSTSMKMK